MENPIPSPFSEHTSHQAGAHREQGCPQQPQPRSWFSSRWSEAWGDSSTVGQHTPFPRLSAQVHTQNANQHCCLQWICAPASQPVRNGRLGPIWQDRQTEEKLVGGTGIWNKVSQAQSLYTLLHLLCITLAIMSRVTILLLLWQLQKENVVSWVIWLPKKASAPEKTCMGCTFC